MGLREWEVKHAISKDKIIRLNSSANPLQLKNNLRSLIRDMNRLTTGAEALMEILEEK